MQWHGGFPPTEGLLALWGHGSVFWQLGGRGNVSPVLGERGNVPPIFSAPQTSVLGTASRSWAVSVQHGHRPCRTAILSCTEDLSFGSLSRLFWLDKRYIIGWWDQFLCISVFQGRRWESQVLCSCARWWVSAFHSCLGVPMIWRAWCFQDSWSVFLSLLLLEAKSCLCV